MTIEINLDGNIDTLEVHLGYLCNHLERNTKAVNTEIENLLKLSHDDIIFGTQDGNAQKIEKTVFCCTKLIQTQLQLLTVIEPTLLQMNKKLNRNNCK